MAYDVKVMSAAARRFDALASAVQPRIAEVLRNLADNPRPHGCKKLKTGMGWSVRVGDYRIIYLIDDSSRAVSVTWIGARGDAYRGN
jgi:mRNA interferase RelE/StbE